MEGWSAESEGYWCCDSQQSEFRWEEGDYDSYTDGNWGENRTSRKQHFGLESCARTGAWSKEQSDAWWEGNLEVN